MWRVTTDPARFDEAVRYFRARVPLTDDEFAAIAEASHQRAFTIAGASQLELVTEAWNEVGRAVEEGSTLEDFKLAVQDKLFRAWGVDDPYRVETIFRNAVQGAYSAGRYKEMTEPAVLKARPFWKFSAILDQGTSSICRRLHGTVLAADDPWWDSHVPPCHHSCRSAILSLRRSTAEAAGVDESGPAVASDEGFGRLPDEQAWTPDLQNYPAPLAEIAKERLG